jgi:alkylresorcinol/alkylpyrone synthase
MYLHALTTAVPAASFTQRECLALARDAAGPDGPLGRRARLLLGAILRGDSGVETRQFAAADPGRLFHLDGDELNETFRRHAPPLAMAALAPALAQADVGPSEVDALIVCTCTGYLCPGLSSYVAEGLGLRADAWLQDLVGLGCGAAIPALRAAGAITAARPHSVVACVAIEVCSAAFYLDDDPGVIISACLFGDGAAATVWRGTPGPSGLQCHGFDTHHDPSARDRIRFEQRRGRLRNLLHPVVPEVASSAVALLHARAEEADQRPLTRVVSHAGGRDVLDAMEAKLPGRDLGPAREILRRHGNMSSPSVLFALEEAMRRHGGPDPGTDWWLASFGAGFAAHSCRLGSL